MATDHASRPRRRPKRLRAKPKPPLDVLQILAWADAFFERHGRWPISTDGRIREAADETWETVDTALCAGRRDLTPGSSLARLLSEHRGVRNRKALPPYTIDGILAWADAYRLPTGRWPNEDSGPVADAPGETWRAVEAALRVGIRGLPGGSSIARLLAEHRGVRNIANLPRLTVSKILAWADAHKRRMGRWPKGNDGPIPESPGDAWGAINVCLTHGRRGLPGGQSLARLLNRHRGVRNLKALPRYTERQILAWADAHYRRTRAWPKLNSGPIVDAPGETWWAVDAALSNGYRGLPGGSSLARLLQRRRGLRHKGDLPRFSVTKILAWARAHHRRTGKLPKKNSGPVFDSPGDTWMAVEMALTKGMRGLPGGSSLAKLLKGRKITKTKS
ncbi:MAG TPA: hypothetical protein VMV10_09855 [Pirellulales bacterium]|nr:hypothetical protein [Pirellulales bacterium]